MTQTSAVRKSRNYDYGLSDGFLAQRGGFRLEDCPASLSPIDRESWQRRWRCGETLDRAAEAKAYGK